MRRQKALKLKSQRGQAIVEFALTLPILLILLLGIIEFSLLLYDKAVLTNASREGARVGIVSQDRSDLAPINTRITNAVNNYCGNHLISFGSTNVTTTPSWPGTRSFGNPLTVTVSYSYKWLLIPNFVAGSGSDLSLGAVTVMNLE